MKKRGRRRQKRGVALVLVLGAISILTIMLTDFQDEATGELSAALADRDSLKAEYLAKSGINLARLLIATEPTIRQGIAFFFIGRTPPQVPVWEFADRVLGAFNDAEGNEQFMALTGTDSSDGKNLGIEGGKFELQIVDEDAKLNVNTAARGDQISELRLATQLLALMAGDRYNPMFEQRDRDDNFTDRPAVCGALIDWADPDENLFACDPSTTAPTTQGAEDITYQLLKKPFFRKNSAYDSLEELHLVRGVSDDFWATFIDPEPTKPKKRVITVWGQGAVNVNTANAQTLLAVVCGNVNPQTTKLCTDPLEAEKFLLGVTLLRTFTAGIPLFSSGNDFIKAMQGQGMVGQLLKALSLEPVVFKLASDAAKMVTAESKMFSFYSDGIVPGYRRKTRVRIHAVVDFRGAPPPDAGILGLISAATGQGAAGAAQGAAALPRGTGGAGGAGATGGGSPMDALQGVIAPNPGGTIIYYRME